MNPFWRRRIFVGGASLAAAVAINLLLKWQFERLGPSDFTSGYLLLAGVVFLTSYHWRKRFPFWPLGKVSTWLQAHIYVALILCTVFWTHVGAWHVPQGTLELLLYVFFLTVAASGIYGLVITRRIPRRLAKLREEFVYERIIALRETVRRQAHGVVVGLATEQDAPTICDFYLTRLVPFFDRPRGLWYYMRPTSRLRNAIHREIVDLQRYYSPEEKLASETLTELVDRRDDMDYHDALQCQLKAWLFLHIGMTYGLLVLVAVHTVLVHAFHGGMR
ncbi:MAG: hypothetical protein KDA60_13415 [Planctomycetales bacterium]|nr:hypothetical protein [Planctomycetales bacterium]